MTPVTGATLLAVTALCVGLGGVPTVTAAADEPTDPISGLVGGLVDPPGDGGRERRDYGRTHADDGVLRPGCHDYRYRYRLDIRSDDWSLETFLDDRTGETIGSGAYVADADPKSGPARFRICRYTTHAGRFTIRAKLVFYTDSGEHKVWLEPSHFRLRRP